jgi:hypothetical protein
MCILIFEKKLKFFIKFTFLKIFKFLLLKKWGAWLIRWRGLFEKIWYIKRWRSTGRPKKRWIDQTGVTMASPTV